VEGAEEEDEAAPADEDGQEAEDAAGALRWEVVMPGEQTETGEAESLPEEGYGAWGEDRAAPEAAETGEAVEAAETAENGEAAEDGEAGEAESEEAAPGGNSPFSVDAGVKSMENVVLLAQKMEEALKALDAMYGTEDN